MKKPQCKNTLAKLVCQAFYGYYMLSSNSYFVKKCWLFINYTDSM